MMIALKTCIFLSILLPIFSLSSASAISKEIRKNHNNQLLKNGLAVASQQLLIVQPNNANPITANSTSYVEISTTSKSLFSPTIPVNTTFNCGGTVFVISSDLGIPQSFDVGANLNSACVIVADTTAPGFVPSDPVIVKVLIPLYYESIIDSTYHTGEVFQIYVRPSDNTVINLNFLITCGAVSRSIPIVTMTTSYYTLPPELYGENCVFSTTNVPSDYITVNPFDADIFPTIIFTSPSQNSVQPAGSSILATLISSNGLNPLITVHLTCNSVNAGSLTQNVKSVFIFNPSNLIYGNCVLSITETSDTYYVESTVNFSYSSYLSFVSPTADQNIQPESQYSIEVTGSSGSSSISVQVVGICQTGGSFQETVNLGIPETFTMGNEFKGTCILTASTTAPYFTPAIVSITVLTELSPEEISEAAKSFVLNGRIIDSTKPLNKKKK